MYLGLIGQSLKFPPWLPPGGQYILNLNSFGYLTTNTDYSRLLLHTRRFQPAPSLLLPLSSLIPAAYTPIIVDLGCLHPSPPSLFSPPNRRSRKQPLEAIARPDSAGSNREAGSNRSNQGFFIETGKTMLIWLYEIAIELWKSIPIHLEHSSVLLGDMGAGKSSLVLRFVKGQFLEFQESTIGAVFFSQTLAVNDATVKFEIWDTAGQEIKITYEGRPVIAVGVGLSTYDKASIHSYVQSHIQINEFRDCVIMPSATKKYERQISTCVKVLDMTGLRLSHLNQIKLLTVISSIDDLNYPEKTDTYYIVNAPYVVKPLLQERTRKKVQVLSGCGKDDLLKGLTFSPRYEYLGLAFKDWLGTG
ncbi:hypothetical protein LXL04_030009 [Taraxacum kok-saghyz]